VIGGGDITPRDGHGRGGATAEINRLQAATGGDGDDAAIAADFAALCGVFDHRISRSGGHALARVEAKPKLGSVRQGTFQLRCQAVCGDNVETGAGADNNVGRLRRDVVIVGGFENGDFTGDVEIMCLRGEAGGNERCRGARERPRAIEQNGNPGEARLALSRRGEGESARGKRELRGKWRELGGAPAGQDGAQATGPRLARDQLAGIAIGAINHQGHERVVAKNVAAAK